MKKLLGLTLAFGLLLTVTAITPTSAHQDPVDCNASGLQQFPSIVSPVGSAYDGDTVTYAITYTNSDPDGAGGIAPCNVTGADADLLLPDGTNIDVLTSATLNVGDSIACPGGAGCAAGPYTYTVDHADEVSGSVTATFDITGVLHQDADEEVAADHDTLSKAIVHPSTLVTITSSETAVLAGGTVDLTVTEQNDGDVDITTPTVEVDNGVGTLSAPPTAGDDGDGILEPGETWSWTVADVVVNTDTTWTATGHGMVNGDNVTWCEDPENPPTDTICDQDERDSVEVTVTSNPTTITTITADATEVDSGATVTLTITEENDGDVDLTDPHVVVDNGVGTLDETSPNFSGDAGDLGVLDPGETWTWTVDVIINTDTTFTATGHGTDPLGNDITFPDDPDEQDSVTITVIVREVSWCSPGYWRNHLDAWEGFGADDSFLAEFPGYEFPPEKKNAKFAQESDPSLLDILQNPQIYGGDAFNLVGDLLSEAHPDVDFIEGDERVEDSCPLN